MKVQFLVTVTFGRIDAQPTAEFESQDAKAMIQYLQEKIEDHVRHSWQYNARVDNVTVKKVKK